MNTRIRDARPDEYALAGELTAVAYAPILAFGPDDPYLEELRDAASRAERAQLLVYESAGEILGTVTVARPGTAYAEIACPYELEVRMLAVAPNAHGRGIGTQLMNVVHEMAIAEQLPTVALSVIATNAPALAFYEALGYRFEPERDWYPVPEMPMPLRVLVKDLVPQRPMRSDENSAGSSAV